MCACHDQYGGKDFHKWQLHRVGLCGEFRHLRLNLASDGTCWHRRNQSSVSVAASPPSSSAAGKLSAAFALGPQALPLGRCSHWIIAGQTPFFTVGFRGEFETAQMRVKRLVQLAVLERDYGVMKDRALDRDCRSWSWATLWLWRRRDDFVEKDLKAIFDSLGGGRSVLPGQNQSEPHAQADDFVN